MDVISPLREKLSLTETKTLHETTSFRIYELVLAENKGSLLISSGLSAREMNVPEKYKEENRVELCMYLPNYWETSSDEERYAWALQSMIRLVEHGLKDNTWYGPGHTIGLSGYEEGFSSATKMNHLLLTSPITYSEAFANIEEQGDRITFYTLIPLFPEEADYKQAKGALKLLNKMNGKGISDKIDDFRLSTLRTRFRLF